MHSILVVDDELSIRESFSLILEGKYKIVLAASGEAALKTITDQKVDMVYLDIRMPGMDGIETLQRMREIDPDLEIIMVTAVNDVQNASKAIKLGARDYVVKPFDVNHILKMTEQILTKKAILAEGLVTQKNFETQPVDLIGQSDKIVEIIKLIENIKNDERILILGEIGTEKESAANMIHQKSKRANLPYRAVSPSQKMSPTEVKRLFFGEGKGSTTVDLEAKTGVFEKAKNGTVLIKNLEALPQDIFKTILSKEFSRLGSMTKIPIEARLIGAAPPALAEKNKEIFEYFSEILIEIPSLRHRSSDIPLLIKHFTEKFGARYKKEVKIEAAAVDALTGYSWPGNTQQMEGLMHRLVLSSAHKEIKLEDLPLDILLKTTQGTGSNFIADFEKEYIRRVFEESGKNKGKAAAFLGISPTVLEVKI
jgi:two-component system response regulator HydG